MNVPQTLIVNERLLDGPSSLRFVGRVLYVQLTAIFTALGGSILWQAKDSQAIVKWRHNMLIVPSTGQTMTLNGEKRTVAHPSQIFDGRLYVALEALADIFSGVSRVEGDIVELSIPVGYFTAVTFSGPNIMLQWTGNEKIDSESADGRSFRLAGTTWPNTLNSITIKRDAQGYLMVNFEAVGTVEHTKGEQSMRLSLKSTGMTLDGITIAVDAGHGGQQPGAVSTTGKLEKDLTRAVVDKLKPLLVSSGGNVIDVRPNDESVTLAERVSRARQGGAKAFVSVHYNAFERAEANGTETFHAMGNQAGAELAASVHRELVRTLGLRDRGVKQAAFHVLQALPEIPAILIEVGFITNSIEEAYLLRESTISLTAEAVARGLLSFYSK